MSKKKERIQSIITIHTTISGRKSIPEGAIKLLTKAVEKLLKMDHIVACPS